MGVGMKPGPDRLSKTSHARPYEPLGSFGGGGFQAGPGWAQVVAGLGPSEARAGSPLPTLQSATLCWNLGPGGFGVRFLSGQLPVSGLPPPASAPLKPPVP